MKIQHFHTSDICKIAENLDDTSAVILLVPTSICETRPFFFLEQTCKSHAAAFWKYQYFRKHFLIPITPLTLQGECLA